MDLQTLVIVGLGAGLAWLVSRSARPVEVPPPRSAPLAEARRVPGPDVDDEAWNDILGRLRD